MIQQGKKYSLKYLIIFPFSCAPIPSLFIFLLSVMNAALPALKVAASASFIDTAIHIARKDEGNWNIYTPLFSIAALLIYELLTSNLRSILQQKLLLRLRETFSAQIIEKQAKIKYQFIEDNETWGLITRITTNVEGFSQRPEESISEGYSNFLEAISIVVSFVSVVSIVAMYAPWVAVFLIALCIPLFVVAFKNGKKQYDTVKENTEVIRWHTDIFQLLTSREFAEERSLFGYVEYFLKRFTHYFGVGRKIFVRMRLQWAVHQKSVGLIMGVALCGVFITLLEPVSSGVMSAGVMIALVQAIITMTTSVSNRLVQLIFETSNNREFLKDLTVFAALEETENAIEPPVKGQTLSKLEFRNVSFRYPNTEKDILRDVSFTIENGRHYSFVGANGAGKTTITKLITGLYDNYEGEIFINGEELRGISGDRLKGYTVCVFQDFAKYQISLKDNIAAGAIGEKDSEKRMEEAIRAVGLEETIQKMPNGVDQQLGRISRDGQDISGGQWQRIAIARAAVNTAPLRILDEPTASLDPISESKVYEQFEQISQGTSTIFISHRLGSTKLADVIFVIGDGTIVEQGSHESLMEENGLYAEMYESQRSWYQ